MWANFWLKFVFFLELNILILKNFKHLFSFFFNRKILVHLMITFHLILHLMLHHPTINRTTMTVALLQPATEVMVCLNTYKFHQIKGFSHLNYNWSFSLTAPLASTSFAYSGYRAVAEESQPVQHEHQLHTQPLSYIPENVQQQTPTVNTFK